MIKNICITIFLLASFGYSQDIDQAELDKLPPEVRQKILDALEKVKQENEKKGIKVDFTAEDLEKFEKEKQEQEKRAKEKEVHPKVPEKIHSKPIDKEKALQLIKELGANHYKIRKKAKIGLIEMGYQVIPLLKNNLSKSDDPEITENIKEIIAKLSHRLHFNQLTDKQKAIAKLPFKMGAVEGNKIKAEFYNSNDHFIIDIGLTRIALPGEIKQVSGSFRRNVSIVLDGKSGGGGSSSSNNFKIYQYSYDGGVGYWALCGHSFTVSSYILEIRKTKLNLKPAQPQILFFGEENKKIGIYDLK